MWTDKKVTIKEALFFNRHERRRLGKLNRMKIPSITNIMKVAGEDVVLPDATNK